MKRRWILTALISVPVFLVALVQANDYYYSPLKFDSVRWKSEGVQARNRMYEDVSRNTVLGRKREKIIQLLGTPEHERTKALPQYPRLLAYDVGDIPNDTVSCKGYLYIYLDQQGIARESHVAMGSEWEGPFE